jgi:hypothetical protein
MTSCPGMSITKETEAPEMEDIFLGVGVVVLADLVIVEVQLSGNGLYPDGSWMWTNILETGGVCSRMGSLDTGRVRSWMDVLEEEKILSCGSVLKVVGG